VTEEEKQPFVQTWWFAFLLLAIFIGFYVWSQRQPEVAPATMMPCKYYQGEPFSTPCEHNGKVVR
jgi:hypothetical protein